MATYVGPALGQLQLSGLNVSPALERTARHLMREFPPHQSHHRPPGLWPSPIALYPLPSDPPADVGCRHVRSRPRVFPVSWSPVSPRRPVQERAALPPRLPSALSPPGRTSARCAATVLPPAACMYPPLAACLPRPSLERRPMLRLRLTKGRKPCPRKSFWRARSVAARPLPSRLGH